MIGIICYITINISYIPYYLNYKNRYKHSNTRPEVCVSKVSDFDKELWNASPYYLKAGI